MNECPCILALGDIFYASDTTKAVAEIMDRARNTTKESCAISTDKMEQIYPFVSFYKYVLN